MLSYKPIPSHLVGWDFVLNPAQTGSHVAPQALGVNTSYYAWDQTILFQSATSGITVDQTSSPNPSGLLSLTAAVPTQMAVIQYLEGYKCTEVLLDAINALSANIMLQTKVPQTLTVSLWWTANSSLPSITSNQSFVNSLDANGHPSSVASQWNEISRGPIGNAQFTTGTNTLQSFGFTGWQSLTAAATAQNFAIVIGTNTVASTNYIYFDDVSLVPGSIATPSAPKSLDEVLRECQFYYETSYMPGVVPGTSSSSATSRIYYQTTLIPGGGVYTAYRSPFDVIFNTPKRIAPTVPATANPTFHFYSPSAGTIDRVDYETYAASKVGSTIVSLSSLWNLSTSTRGVHAIQNSVAVVSSSAFPGDCANSIVLAHFSADSRLGVI